LSRGYIKNKLAPPKGLILQPQIRVWFYITKHQNSLWSLSSPACLCSNL